MRIHHIAIWVKDIEAMKDFYVSYFDCTASEKYINPLKRFQSYFLSFNGETALELMNSGMMEGTAGARPEYGYAHLAVSVGSNEIVDRMTGRLRADGYTIESAPRQTGDGYYEAVVLDPEGNRIEITV
ncbi:MAG: hypothetical protein A2Y33_10365 [Spirochaetes bacterium GWF1_51_8]|nr:MAG: hypothetical protein A2Y33_10365 [Spirochaetes bacterium GWF1_51_8]